MLNAEKFKKEILDIAERGYCFAVSKDRQNIARSCDDLKCEDCIFNEGDDCSCNFPRMKWLLSEYRELIKLSKLIQAISKIKRNGLDPINASHLDEEVADVLICICELYAMDCLDVYEIAEIIKSKVGRSMKRTQDYLYELQEVDSCKGDVW